MPVLTRQPEQKPRRKLTPEQVKAISARVYALLLADLRLENERLGLTRKPAARP